MNFVDNGTGRHAFEYTPVGPAASTFFISIDMVPCEAYRPDSAYAGYLDLPNLRELMDRGVFFSNACSCSPLCGPSRAGYLTGRYPYLTVNEERAHDGQAIALRESDVIFPEYLKAVGYHTRHVGKSHVGTELFTRAFSENDAPWNRWAPPTTDDDAYLSYLADRGIKPMRFKTEIRGRTPDRKSEGNSYGGFIEQSDGTEFPIEGTYPFYLAERAVRTVEAWQWQTGGKTPIYLQLDFFAPHQPFMIPAGFEDRAETLRKVIEVPRSFANAIGRDGKAGHDEPRIYETYRKHIGINDPEVMREYILCNFLQMEVIDAALGHFFDALKRLEIYDPSMIVFIGDHGEMNGERALVDKGAYGHSKVARVPMVVKLPGNDDAGRTVDRLVSLLDLAPTILEHAGVKPLTRLDGESLMPFVRGDRSKRDKPMLFETHWHVAPNPSVSLIDTPVDDTVWMYTYNLTSDVDELYELADFTFTNRAGDARLTELKNTMIQKLGAVLSSDPRWRCYWHTMRLDKFDLFPADATDMQMFVPDR